MGTLGYNGNPKLRRAYTQIAMTQHEVSEYKKCATDPIYFIKNYMKIVVLGKGIQPFLTHKTQQKQHKAPKWHPNKVSAKSASVAQQ